MPAPCSLPMDPLGPAFLGRRTGPHHSGLPHWATLFGRRRGACSDEVKSDGSHKVTAACSTGDSRMFATENNVKSEEAGGCAHYSYGPAMYTCALLQTVCKHSAISNSLLTSPAMKTLLIMFRS